MRVLYIYDGDWPKGATRVGKQTRSLARAGHEVFLLSRNRLRAPRVEEHEWMLLLRLPHFPGDRLNSILNFPAFFNPVWLSAIWRSVVTRSIEAIVVVDLPLAPAALLVARIMGVPIHMDMGEVYPAFLEGLRATGSTRRFDWLVRSPAAARALERLCVPRMDSVFVVSDESGERCSGLLRVPTDRVVVVRNTPDATSSNLPGPLERPAHMTDRPTVLFVGIMIHDRGLMEAVKAMALLRATMPEVALVLVGDGPERPRLEAAVREMDLSHTVSFGGWQPHELLPAYYAHATLGILPFLNVGQIGVTLANKLFDYMAAGLPVVASDVPPMRRIMDEVDCGRLAAPGDPEALAFRLAEVLGSSDRAEMGERGRRAVQTKYNWDLDGSRFVERVEAVGPAL